jgi:hypothetical protein
MTEPTLLSLIRQVRAQRHATDALEGKRLRLEASANADNAEGEQSDSADDEAETVLRR